MENLCFVYSVIPDFERVPCYFCPSHTHLRSSAEEMKRPKHHPGARTGAPPPPSPPARPTSFRSRQNSRLRRDPNLHAPSPPPHKIALRQRDRGKSETALKIPFLAILQNGLTTVRRRSDNLSGRGFNPSLSFLSSPLSL